MTSLQRNHMTYSTVIVAGTSSKAPGAMAVNSRQDKPRLLDDVNPAQDTSTVPFAVHPEGSELAITSVAWQRKTAKATHSNPRALIFVTGRVRTSKARLRTLATCASRASKLEKSCFRQIFYPHTAQPQVGPPTTSRCPRHPTPGILGRGPLWQRSRGAEAGCRARPVCGSVVGVPR